MSSLQAVGAVLCAGALYNVILDLYHQIVEGPNYPYESEVGLNTTIAAIGAAITFFAN